MARSCWQWLRVIASATCQHRMKVFESVRRCPFAEGWFGNAAGGGAGAAARHSAPMSQPSQQGGGRHRRVDMQQLAGWGHPSRVASTRPPLKSQPKGVLPGVGCEAHVGPPTKQAGHIGLFRAGSKRDRTPAHGRVQSAAAAAAASHRRLTGPAGLRVGADEQIRRLPQQQRHRQGNYQQRPPVSARPRRRQPRPKRAPIQAGREPVDYGDAHAQGEAPRPQVLLLGPQLHPACRACALGLRLWWWWVAAAARPVH